MSRDAPLLIDNFPPNTLLDTLQKLLPQTATWDIATRKPELYFLQGARANELITHKYEKHSSRISRADVQTEFKDHDFGLIERLLGFDSAS